MTLGFKQRRKEEKKKEKKGKKKIMFNVLKWP